MPELTHGQASGSTGEMAGLLPAGVVTVAAYESEWETTLLDAEEPIVARATDQRRREFAAARNCARRALAQLGVQDFPILAGEAREPLWPVGITGSITHGAGYCAAAVAPLGSIRSLGIDVAPNVPFPQEARDLTCTPAELRRIRRSPQLDIRMLLFSAKESAYKAWYQIAGTWFDYLDVEVDVDLDARAFSARLLAPVADQGTGLPGSFAGRFGVAPGHIFTAVTVPARATAAG